MLGRESIVVMDVSGAGKSTVARDLAFEIGLPFADADDYHDAAAVEKMRQGTPMTDGDRWPWLDRVGIVARSRPTVVACSALRRIYRDRIRIAAPDAWFVELDIGTALAAQRMRDRPGHFMPATLAASQYATLEPLDDDEHGIRVNAAAPIDAVVASIVDTRRSRAAR